MRHRSVASIVCATSLIVVLTGCMNVNMSDGPSSAVHDSGSIAPHEAPVLAPYQLVALDMPQSAIGQPVSEQKVAEKYAALTSALGTQKGVVWAHIIDAHTGETVFSDKANTARTPASITKILAALTAHHHLDENATLATGTSLAGSDLYLWGSGDLLVGTEPTADVAAPAGTSLDAGASINGRASLADLARDTASMLEKRGVNSVTLNWAPHPFDGPAHLPEWAAQEVQDYEGRVGAYAIDSGRLTGERTFVADPEKAVAESFMSLLEAQGLSVQWGSQRSAPEGAVELALVHSATIGEHIRYMLFNSDNTVADQLCRLAARAAGNEASYVGSAQTVENTLHSLGVSPESLMLKDCSGLSSSDRILPETLTSALRAASRSDRADLRDLVRNLPWAGAQGTMVRRFFDGSAIGNVQAKTGSLGHVSSLAGQVRTASGRELIFAVGVDETDDGVAYFMRPAIDEFIQALTTL